MIGACSGIVLLVVIQIVFRILGFLGYPYDMTGEFIRIKNVVSNNKIALINMVFIIPFVTEIVYRNVVFGYLYDYKCKTCTSGCSRSCNYILDFWICLFKDKKNRKRNNRTYRI